MLKDEIIQICENAKHDEMEFYEKIKRHPLHCLFFILFFILLFVLVLWTLIELPQRQVSHFDINNATQQATLENLYRATIVQILGGSAVAIGIYFAWGNLITAREGQITERFTRAVDQLGNPGMEIRLGGIYALGRIANESKKDYWPIMEILTAYVRKNSNVKDENSLEIVPISMDVQANESIKNKVLNEKNVSLDIQAILTVIGRREHSFESLENRIDLRETNLQHTNLLRANFSNAIIVGADLSGANLALANLSRAFLSGSNFSEAKAIQANFKKANLALANLSRVKFINADLSMVFFPGANLSGTDFYGANLQGAKQLTIDQLSQVKTLYKAKLDEDLKKPLREKYPELFEEPIFGCYHISAQKK
jgi:uncharacterized protein YjbI with pentapeptide repeats